MNARTLGGTTATGSPHATTSLDLSIVAAIVVLSALAQIVRIWMNVLPGTTALKIPSAKTHSVLSRACAILVSQVKGIRCSHFFHFLSSMPQLFFSIY